MVPGGGGSFGATLEAPAGRSANFAQFLPASDRSS